MLKIFNELKPFFEDNYAEIGVREYARKINVSPPTASKLLKYYYEKGILREREERLYKFYRANRESWLFLSLLRMYWEYKIRESAFIEYVQQNLIHPVVILFGSSVKGELKKDSDLDIAIFTPVKKDLKIERFEKTIGRDMHLLIFTNKRDVRNKNLLLNILNGYRLVGEWNERLE